MMIDPVTFFKGLGIAMGIIILFSGFFFWIGYYFHKYRFAMRFFFKYKIFRRKYKEEDVRVVMETISSPVASESLSNDLLLQNKYSYSKIQEFLYIYRQMLKRMKGGSK